MSTTECFVETWENEPHAHAQECYVYTKIALYFHKRKPYISALGGIYGFAKYVVEKFEKKPCIRSKERSTYGKEPYVAAKEPTVFALCCINETMNIDKYIYTHMHTRVVDEYLHTCTCICTYARTCV